MTKIVIYEKRKGFKNYFVLTYKYEKFGNVYQDYNNEWYVQIDRSDYDIHTFKYRTRAMDYIEHELKVKEDVPFDMKISRPRYQK